MFVGLLIKEMKPYLSFSTRYNTSLSINAFLVIITSQMLKSRNKLLDKSISSQKNSIRSQSPVIKLFNEPIIYSNYFIEIFVRKNPIKYSNRMSK